jgi:hypothetical protein
MIASVHAEWVKLRTTAVPWVLSGIAVLITGLLVLLFFVSHDAGGGPGANGGNGTFGSFGPPTPSIPHTVQQLRDLVGAGITGYLFALLLGVLIVTTEFRHKTVTTSLLVSPRRSTFVVAKLVLAAIVSAVLGVLVLVVTVVGGGVTVAVKGGTFSSVLHQVPAVAPGVILVFVLMGILGVGVGSLLTNQVAALVVCLGWFLIVQTIISGIWSGTIRWLPSGAASAAASVTRGRGSDVALFAWWQGTLLILAYGLVFALVGSAVLTRRDIT